MLIRNIISNIKVKIACCCSACGNRGSFLLEIAVALSVLGLISGFLITKSIVANRAIRLQTTKHNIEYVKSALGVYLANYNRLPKPSHDASGKESAAGGGLADFVGNVPYNTLGIPKKYTIDGNAKPLVYIVEPQLTANFSSINEKPTLDSSEFCKWIANPSIEVQGVGEALPSIIAFVIDTKQPAISDKIRVVPTSDTSWISRDIFLMQYLKNSPCKKESHHDEVERSDRGVAHGEFFF